jgi:bacterioferritin (cytochrome b1)
MEFIRELQHDYKTREMAMQKLINDQEGRLTELESELRDLASVR